VLGKQADRLVGLVARVVEARPGAAEAGFSDAL